MSGAAETIGGLLEAATQRLRDAGRESPGRDARLLLAWAAKLPQSTILGWPERVPAPEAAAHFEQTIERRAQGEPVTRIIGRRGFWTLDLALGPATLDPRPDTETVVEAALAAIPDRKKAYRLLDLGTGTGAILLALLSELPNAFGIGIDLAPDALRVAAANATANGLESRAAFAASDWAASLTGEFDLIVSNPPYIASADIARLAPEVRCHDPVLALDGGHDGLRCYRGLAAELPRLLTVDGFAVLEMGACQGPAIADLMRSAGLRVIGQRPDLTGILRALTLARA